MEAELSCIGFEDILTTTVCHLPSVDAEVFTQLFSGMLAQLLLNSGSWTKDDVEKYGKSFGPAMSDYLTKKYGQGQPIKFEMVAVLSTTWKPIDT